MSAVVEFGITSFRQVSAEFRDENPVPKKVNVKFTQDYILKVYDLAKATLESIIIQSEIFLFP